MSDGVSPLDRLSLIDGDAGIPDDLKLLGIKLGGMQYPSF